MCNKLYAFLSSSKLKQFKKLPEMGLQYNNLLRSMLSTDAQKYLHFIKFTVL